MKIKTLILVLILNFLLGTLNSFAQSPNWQWAKSAGGTSSDYGQGCSTDAGGNIFVTGYFYSPTITFGTTVLTNADNTGNSCDMFIVKYDTGGNVLWAQRAGGAWDDDYGQGCSTDAGGNIFVTGSFKSPTLTFGTTVLTNANNTGTINEMFIVKYDPSGNVLWAKSAGGTSGEEGLGCSTDAGGNIFVTGYFYSNTLTFGTTVLTNAGGGSADMFIVKYDAGGNVLWAQRADGTNWEEGSGCSTDAGGNIFVTGTFQSPTLTFGTTVLTNAGSPGWHDIFIVKYDAGGNVLWAQRAGGAFADYGQDCSTDTGGNVFVTGYFDSPTITFGTTVLTNAGNQDMFIVKYDAGGNVLWAKSAGGMWGDFGLGCSTDAGGNIFVTGYFSSAFGSGCFNWDMFIMKYDAGGNVLWTKSAGGISDEQGLGCSTDAGGNIFVTGYFKSNTITFGTTVLTNAGNSGMFIVKLADTTTTGINELSDEESFSVFPNPFIEKTTISIQSSEFHISEMKIFDVYGKEVKKLKIETPKQELSRNGLRSGVYFYQILSEEKIISSGKLVIQ